MDKEIEQEPTEKTEPLELAKDAIAYALRRVREDENIRYHMGAFTEAFERLKAAHSALTGKTEDDIEAWVFVELKRKSKAEIFDEIKDVVNRRESKSIGVDEAFEEIATICERA